MTIKPVDLQVLIPRVTEVGKAQHVMNQQDTLQQQQFAGKWEHIATDRQHQVQSTNKSEDTKVAREKQKEQQKQSKDSSKQKDGKEKHTDVDGDNPLSKDPARGHLIDIKT